MSAIQQAIAKLNTAIDNLDGSVTNAQNQQTEQAQQAATNIPPGAQPDMFGGPQIANANAIAEKLDSIIESAETVLQEGAA